MAGGMRIEDKGGYPGDSDGMMKSKTHLKEYKSAEGSGHESDYDDTTEAIKRDQMAGSAKIRSKPMKAGYRY